MIGARTGCTDAHLQHLVYEVRGRTEFDACQPNPALCYDSLLQRCAPLRPRVTLFQLTRRCNHTMRHFLKLAAAALILGALSTVATAQTAQVYIGAGAGYSISSTEVTSPSVPGLSLDGLGSRGAVGGIHGGIDVYLSNSQVFVGVFGSYSWQDVEFSLALAPVAGLSAKLSDSYSVGGRIGMMVGGVKPYLLAAYTHTKMEWSANAGGVPVVMPSAPDFSGLTLGGGVDVPLAKNLSWGLIGTYTRFGEENVAIGPGASINLQPEQLYIGARLTLSFGADGIVADQKAKSLK